MQVRYPDPDPSGLALMLGGLIEGNLAAHPERKALLSPPASYSILATDIEVAVTIRLSPQGVAVRNGFIGSPNVGVRTDSETLMGLSSVPLRFGLPDIATKEGREVSRKLLKRQLRVRGLLTNPTKLARLNKLLSVS